MAPNHLYKKVKELTLRSNIRYAAKTDLASSHLIADRLLTSKWQRLSIQLHSTEHCEKTKLQKYADAYKNKYNTHFIPVLFESSGGAFREKKGNSWQKILEFLAMRIQS